MIILLLALCFFCSFLPDCRNCDKIIGIHHQVSVDLDSESEWVPTDYTQHLYADSQLQVKELAEITFTKEQVFGSSDDILLGTILDIAVDHLDRVYLADRDLITVHVFDREGTYITGLGRQGHGPGEFDVVERNTQIKFDESHIYIADGYYIFPERVHVFSLEDLSFAETLSIAADNKEDYGKEMKHFYPWEVYPALDGNLLILYKQSDLPKFFNSGRLPNKFFIQNRKGEIVSGPLVEQKKQVHYNYEYPGNRFVSYAFPFLPRSLHAVSQSGEIFIADSPQFKIDVYHSDGTVSHSIEQSFDYLPLSRRRIIDRYRQIDMSRLDYREGDNAALKMIQQADDLPDRWPALNDLIVDDENRLWVSTFVEDFEVYEWCIMEQNGELITKFEWPRNEPIEVIKNGKMYTRQTDEETGLQQVVRYRVKMEEI